MSNNSNLHRAKKARNDEFYTMLSDIEKRAYWDELRAKAYGRLEATLAGLVYDFGKRKKEEQ